MEDIQRRAATACNGSFFFYSEGYQFFTDHKYLMQIHYPKNHFVSVVESGDPETVKTIYGYGSHYYIDKIPDAKIEYVRNLPMWCEVIHEKNMGNDAYFLNAKLVKADAVASGFRLQVSDFKSGLGVYLFRYLPRYCKTFVRRIIIRLRGYRFE